MNKLLLTLALAGATACASPGPGLVPIEVNGPVARTIERVLSRTEAYLAKPELMADAEVEAAIDVARAMTSMSSVSGAVLSVTMGPIMRLHDTLVLSDPALDQLEREIYMEDTARLRALFDSVSIHELAPVN